MKDEALRLAREHAPDMINLVMQMKSSKGGGQDDMLQSAMVYE